MRLELHAGSCVGVLNRNSGVASEEISKSLHVANIGVGCIHRKWGKAVCLRNLIFFLLVNLQKVY